MTGSITFNWSWPAWAAIAIAVSAPTAWKETMQSISAMTGFTLPGIIDEPGWAGGGDISAMPVLGPDERRRTSLAILMRSRAASRKAPEKEEKSVELFSASNVSPAFFNSFMPLAFLRASMALSL